MLFADAAARKKVSGVEGDSRTGIVAGFLKFLRTSFDYETRLLKSQRTVVEATSAGTCH